MVFLGEKCGLIFLTFKTFLWDFILLETVLIAICMMAIISPLSTRCQDDPEVSVSFADHWENPCSQAQGICENQVWLLDTLDIMLPEYPNCVLR